MARVFSFIGYGLIFGALVSCAYNVGTGERRLPDGYRLVTVPVFKNTTQEVGAEVPFTNAMIREIERAQVARVVSQNRAQVSLEGTVSQVSYDVANQIAGAPLPTRTVLNSEYRVTVVTKLTLKRLSDGAVLWDETFQMQKNYLAPKIGIEGLNSANSLYNQSAHNENLAGMAQDLMSEAYGRLTESF